MNAILASFSGIRRRWQRHAAIRELSALPDWQLNDIGLVRANISMTVDQMMANNLPKAQALAAKTVTEREHHYVEPNRAAA